MGDLKVLIAAVDSARRLTGEADLSTAEAADAALYAACRALEAELHTRTTTTAADPLLRLIREYGDLRASAPWHNEHGDPGDGTTAEAKAFLLLDDITAMVDQLRRGLPAAARDV